MKKKVRQKTKARAKGLWEKKVKTTAMCANFEIQIEGCFTTFGLSSEEVTEVQRKLRHGLAKTIASLPFAHIYPHEVVMR